jgi:hypothetical protein
MAAKQRGQSEERKRRKPTDVEEGEKGGGDV